MMEGGGDIMAYLMAVLMISTVGSEQIINVPLTDERSIINPDNSLFEKITATQNDVHNGNKLDYSNPELSFFNHNSRPQFRTTPEFRTSSLTSIPKTLSSFGVPIQTTVESGKNLDLYTAKDYDGLDMMEDSYTTKLLSSIGLIKPQSNRDGEKKQKTFRLVQDKMKPADHSRRQRYNSKSVLKNTSPTDQPENVKVNTNSKTFKTTSKTNEKSTPTIRNQALTKIPENKVKPKIEKAVQKTITSENKHFRKVIQLLDLLREYSGLQITQDELLKDNSHHSGARKQILLPVTTTHDDKMYSSNFIPESEIRNSDREAINQGKLNKENLEKLSTGDFFHDIPYEKSQKHHYVTIDTTTGEIIKEELVAGNTKNKVDKLSTLVGKLLTRAGTKTTLKKTPPTHNTGRSRALVHTTNKYHLTPEITIAVPANHRTGGKKDTVHGFHQIDAVERSHMTKDYENDTRKRMLSDISKSLRFVNNAELKSIDDKLQLLKTIRKNSLLKHR